MYVSLKGFIPALFVGTLGLTACESVSDRAEKYLSTTNHLQNDLNKIRDSKCNIKRQSMLDSIAYRDIFNLTAAIKDSSKVAEFNKIAANMRATRENDSWDNYVIIDEKLAEAGITVEDFKKIEDTDSPWDDDVVRICRRQHYADDWAYRKFFDKIGIMNDSITKKCDEVSEKIRP